MNEINHFHFNFTNSVLHVHLIHFQKHHSAGAILSELLEFKQRWYCIKEIYIKPFSSRISLNPLKTMFYCGNRTFQENNGLNGMWIVVDQSEPPQLGWVAEYFEYLNFTSDIVTFTARSRIHRGYIWEKAQNKPWPWICAILVILLKEWRATVAAWIHLRQTRQTITVPAQWRVFT